MSRRGGTNNYKNFIKDGDTESSYVKFISVLNKVK